MIASRQKGIKNSGSDEMANADPHVNKIDRTAPAGSENSLGAESVRDGRPDTDDDTVEAIDEEGPGIASVATRKDGAN